MTADWIWSLLSSFGDADLRDWFASYVQDTHAGCVLNPLKVARGKYSFPLNSPIRALLIFGLS
jgi:hypothetical protein